MENTDLCDVLASRKNFNKEPSKENPIHAESCLDPADLGELCCFIKPELRCSGNARNIDCQLKDIKFFGLIKKINSEYVIK